ncbi:hypothetical protein TKK_0007983 [Trichogramma kaykai]
MSSRALNWDQVKTFMDEAPDYTYLVTKVILLFGICGALRSCDIYDMLVSDVHDMGNQFFISTNNNRHNGPINFIIDELYYQKVKDYIELRPSNFPSAKFFIKFSNGMYIRQALGKHQIEEIPKMIASYLGLNPNEYTGCCFRRTISTLLYESGVSMHDIKKIGRFPSNL